MGVLGKLSADDIKAIEGLYENIYDSIALMLEGKIDEAMNKFSK